MLAKLLVRRVTNCEKSVNYGNRIFLRKRKSESTYLFGKYTSIMCGFYVTGHRHRHHGKNRGGNCSNIF